MRIPMTKETLLRIFSRRRLESFFMGRIYPIVVAALVLCGYFMGAEFYLHFVNMALVCTALCVCRSIRPTIIVLCSFVFQISREHTPSNNNITGVPSDYYFTEGRGVALVISFAVVAAAFVYFFVRNKLITRDTLRSLPLVIPSAILALAFVLGGAFSSVWSFGSVGYSLVQVVVWFVIFYVYLLGFKNERGSELVGYLTYAMSIVAAILLIELAEIYISADGLYDAAGNISRGGVIYGWGVTNTAAQALTVLIPIMFIGTVKSKHSIYYFVMATLTFLGSILNLSRTALVVGVPIYVASLIIVFIKSNKKKIHAVEIGMSVAIIAALVLIFREYTFPAFDNYVDRGLGDSGRYEIWRNGFAAFLDAPIFGKGFFGLNDTVPGFSNAEFIPFMMHNTIVHMPACFGIFGSLAYSYYRIKTIKPFVKRPTTDKALLGLALLSVLLGSLFENFIFYILPMFSYSVVFAVCFKLVAEEREEESKVSHGSFQSSADTALCALANPVGDTDTDEENLPGVTPNEELESE